MEFVQPIKDKKKLEAIKKVLKADSLRNYAVFILGINSGLRISDLLSLKVSDVLDEKNRLKDRVIIKEKKTGKNKEFPFGNTTKVALKEYLNSFEYASHMYLFPSKKGGLSLSRQQAYRIINDAARAVGIKERIGTHTLRKTFGYWAYQQGVDITRIQKLLNHSAPSVTLAYIGITQEELDNVYLTLNL